MQEQPEQGSHADFVSRGCNKHRVILSKHTLAFMHSLYLFIHLFEIGFAGHKSQPSSAVQTSTCLSEASKRMC